MPHQEFQVGVKVNSVPTIAQDCRKLVIVGASLAGLRAVEAARTEGFTGEIALIGDEQHLPYDRPPLSKAFLEGRTQDTTFRDVATLTDELGVQLHLGSPATGLDLEHRKVIAGGSEIEYDRLIIATGSTARTIDGGSALRGVHVLRTKDDAVAIREAVTPGARVIVVGGGFIGSEVASSCLKLGARATIVEAAPVPLTRAVGSLGAALTTLHGMNGVEVRTGLAVDELLGENRITAVRLSDGSILEADLLIVGIGSSPATSWLEHSGLALHPIDRGVLCDENLATNSDGVYAAGDVATGTIQPSVEECGWRIGRVPPSKAGTPPATHFDPIRLPTEQCPTTGVTGTAREFSSSACRTQKKSESVPAVSKKAV